MSITIEQGNIFFCRNEELCKALTDAGIHIKVMKDTAAIIKVAGKVYQTPPPICIDGIIKVNNENGDDFTDEIVKVIKEKMITKVALYGWSVIVHKWHHDIDDRECRVTVRGVLV